MNDILTSDALRSMQKALNDGEAGIRKQRQKAADAIRISGPIPLALSLPKFDHPL